MYFFPDPATIFIFGSFAFTWYMLFFILALIVAFLGISVALAKHGYDQRTTDFIFVIAIIGSLLGGRIGYVLENFHEYYLYAWYIFSIMDGGFEPITAYLGAGIAIYWYILKTKMSLFRTMDTLAPVFITSVVMIRCGRAITAPNLWPGIILDFIFVIVLTKVYMPFKNGHKRGDVTALVLLWFGVMRLSSCVFKVDSLAAHSLITAILAEAGGILLYVRNRRYKALKPVVLFDFDGTLMDSEGMVIHCFQYLFEKYGDPKDFTRELQLEVFGPPLHDMMKKLFPDRDPEVMVQEYRLYQNTLPEQHIVQLLPNTEAVLRELKAKGYKIGIVSTRLTDSCKMWLDEFGITDLFDVILGRDQVVHPKPDPEGIVKACTLLGEGHDQCVYVGDNASDIIAAKKAGVYAVAYVSQKEKLQQIKDQHPNYLITELGELLPELETNNHAWTYEKI